MPVAALILGILAILLPGLGFLIGIVAIVLAIIVLNRRGPDGGPPAGKGMAIGGLVTGGVGVLLWVLVLPGLLIPAITLTRARAREQASMANLRQIVVACVAYGDEDDGGWPTDLDVLRRQQRLPETVFRAPGGEATPAPHYCYVRPADDAGATTVVVVENPALRRHRMLVAYADGHVAALTDHGRDLAALWREAQTLAASPQARGDGVPAAAWSASWSP